MENKEKYKIGVDLAKDKDKTGNSVVITGGVSKEDRDRNTAILAAMAGIPKFELEKQMKEIEAEKARKVGVPVIKDISTLKEMPEYKPLDFPGFKYATLIHGVPVVVHENGQMFIIQNTTHKKRDLVMKHINQAVKEGYVEIRELDKEIHFIDNQVVCDIKKLLKEQK